MHPKHYDVQTPAPMPNIPCSQKLPFFSLERALHHWVTVAVFSPIFLRSPKDYQKHAAGIFGSRPPFSRYFWWIQFVKTVHVLHWTHDESHFNVNTMFDAGAMPPLVRAAQNVSLASTGELNLGNSSTAISASLPGSRFTCTPKA